MIDTDKLYKILTNDENLQDIPIRYIVEVTTSVIKALDECIKGEEYE